MRLEIQRNFYNLHTKVFNNVSIQYYLTLLKIITVYSLSISINYKSRSFLKAPQLEQ